MTICKVTRDYLHIPKHIFETGYGQPQMVLPEYAPKKERSRNPYRQTNTN